MHGVRIAIYYMWTISALWFIYLTEVSWNREALGPSRHRPGSLSNVSIVTLYWIEPICCLSLKCHLQFGCWQEITVAKSRAAYYCGLLHPLWLVWSSSFDGFVFTSWAADNLDFWKTVYNLKAAFHIWHTSDIKVTGQWLTPLTETNTAITAEMCLRKSSRAR